MSTPGIVGVLCADKLGMCLLGNIHTTKHDTLNQMNYSLYLAHGNANPSYSGSLTSLSQLASTMEQTDSDPVILFEGQDK